MSEDKNEYYFITVQSLDGVISSGTWKGESQQKLLESSIENGLALLMCQRLPDRESFDKLNESQEKLKQKIRMARLTKL